MTLGGLLADTSRLLADTSRLYGGHLASPAAPATWREMAILPIPGIIPPTGEGGNGLGSHLAAPPPHIGNSSFLPLSPYLNDFCPIFLLLFSPLDTALLFDVNTAIMGWLLLAVQL